MSDLHLEKHVWAHSKSRQFKKMEMFNLIPFPQKQDHNISTSNPDCQHGFRHGEWIHFHSTYATGTKRKYEIIQGIVFNIYKIGTVIILYSNAI